MSESRSEGRLEAVHRIEFAVDWHPGHVAAYLVDCAEPVLVDAGMTGDGATEELEAGLAEAGYDPGDVEHLVVTHPHTDHVGQVPTVLAAGDPTVYAPASVEERFGRDTDELAETVRENARAAGVQGGYLDEAVEMSVESLERDRGLLPPESVDEWIDRGESVQVGEYTFESVHAPGHQADHLCYRTDIAGDSVLFSGDMALESFRSVALHDGFGDGYVEAIDAFYDGLDRLAEVDADRVYTGHDPAHGDLQAAVADDRDSLDRLLDRTRDELAADEGKTAVEIAFGRSGDRDVRYLVIETASALATLHREGELEATTDEHGVRRYTLA
ncbi:MAG: MBL fold metallo-hydrolase [Halorientalis sp.]